MRASIAVLLFVLLVPSPRSSSRAEEENPIASPIKAILFQEDEALRRTFYKGIVRGLEQANLPRVTLEEAPDEASFDAVVARFEADPPPLLFVLGADARRRLGTRLVSVPRIYVDVAWSVNAEPLPRLPEVAGPAAVVRSVLGAIHLAEILRDLGYRRPPARLSWTSRGDALEARAADLASAVGFRLAAPDESPGVLLHLRLHEGERPRPFADLVEDARRERIPLVSDDLAHWGRGAAILLLPDTDLLGRVAAEQGRRLLLDPERSLPPRHVAAYEIRVDLGAAARQGLEPPLGFLARADRLRRPPPEVGGPP